MWLLLLKHWRLAGFGLLVLAFGLYVGYLKLQITAISADLRAARAEIGALSVRVAERDALLETQNGYIQAWKLAAEKNHKLRAEAERRAADLAARIPRLPIPTPPAAQKACLERDQWLRNELNSLLWPAQ